MRALIIEDETAAARNLVKILSEVAPHVTVLKILESIEESVKWFKSEPIPDVIFLDIHLSDGSAFLIFEQVEINVPVIFVTAYDQYALEAFKVNSIDYLLKPINAEAVRRALEKLKKLDVNNVYEIIREIKYKKKEYQNLKNLLIIAGDKLIPLALEKISFFYTQKEKVLVFTHDNESFIVDKTLESLVDLLPGNQFFRANRQFIISSKSISEVEFWFGSRLKVSLTIDTPEGIIISKNRVSAFKLWLQDCLF